MNQQHGNDHTKHLKVGGSTLAEVDSTALTFQVWFGKLVRARSAKFAAFGTAATIGLGMIQQWNDKLSLPDLLNQLLPWITAVHYGMQAIVILILLITLIPDRCAKLVGPDRDSFHFATRVQSKFYSSFRCVWISWFFLYSVMALCAFAAQRNIDEALNQDTPESKLDKAAFINFASGTLDLDWANNWRQSIEEQIATNAKARKDIANDTANLDLNLALQKTEGNDIKAEFYKHAITQVFTNAGDKAAKEHANVYRMRIDESKVLDAITKMEDAKSAKTSSRKPVTNSSAPFERKIQDFLTTFRRGLALKNFVIHLVGNIQTLALFSCYFALLYKPKSGGDGPDLSALLFLGVIVFILTALDSMVIVFDMHLHNQSVFGFTESLFGGVAMAMLFSRLESRRLGGAPWLMALLFAYAVLQLPSNMPVVTAADTILSSLLFTGYLLAKVVFYAYACWLLQSGLLLYYIYSRAENGDADDRDRRRFLAEHVAPPAAQIGSA